MAKEGVQIYAQDSSGRGELEKISKTEVGGVTCLNTASPIAPRNNIEGVGDITIGTSEVSIAVTGATTSIRIQADSVNSGIIYIGKTGVLADGSNDFVRLSAGDEILIDYDDSTNGLYAISDVASQLINVGAIL